MRDKHAVLRWQTGDALQFWGMAVEIGCKKLYVFREVFKVCVNLFFMQFNNNKNWNCLSMILACERVGSAVWRREAGRQHRGPSSAGTSVTVQSNNLDAACETTALNTRQALYNVWLMRTKNKRSLGRWSDTILYCEASHRLCMRWFGQPSV